MANDLRAGLIEAGRLLGVDPLNIGTVVGYETGGSFNPWQRGPTTKWGTHRGLIQFGEPQAQKYGAFQGQSAYDQLTGSVVSYLKDAGVQPGMGLLDLYSAVNAGRGGRYNASDAAAGGAPGTVADKVANQMGGHRDRAAAILGGDYTPAASTMPTATQAQGAPISTTPAASQPDQGSDYEEVAAILQRLTRPQRQAQAAPVYDLAAEPSALAGMMDDPRPASVFDASRFYALLGRR